MHRSTFNHIVAACSTEDRHSTRYSLQIVMPQVRNSIKWIIAVLERCSFVFLARVGPRPETRTFFAFRCTDRKPRGQVQRPRTVNNSLIAQPRKMNPQHSCTNIAPDGPIVPTCFPHTHYIDPAPSIWPSFRMFSSGSHSASRMVPGHKLPKHFEPFSKGKDLGFWSLMRSTA